MGSGIDAGAVGTQLDKIGLGERGEHGSGVARMESDTVATDRESHSRKGFAVEDDFALVVHDRLGRQLVVGQRDGQSRAGTDIHGEPRSDLGVVVALGAGARALGDHRALPHFAVGSGLRHGAPGAVLEMHLLAGGGLWNFGPIGGKRHAGGRIEQYYGAEHQGPIEDFAARHRAPPLLRHFRQGIRQGTRQRIRHGT
jgi:hypothetical protein